MSRRKRMYIPGQPYHVVQRGNNQHPCFIEPENYKLYLELWKTVAKRYGVAVHAYCLMANHIHFLITPETETAISETMKMVGSRYAQYINLKYMRSGTLWQGRHHSSLIQSDKYLLTCMRYIELNPVRAAVVERPEAYKWSSYGTSAGEDESGNQSWLKFHDEYYQLGTTLSERQTAYRELFKHPVKEVDLDFIRKAAHYCQPVGSDRFRQFIEEKYDIKLGQLRRGRPRKEKVRFG